MDFLMLIMFAFISSVFTFYSHCEKLKAQDKAEVRIWIKKPDNPLESCLVFLAIADSYLHALSWCEKKDGGSPAL